jgi:hypothetical protein
LGSLTPEPVIPDPAALKEIEDAMAEEEAQLAAPVSETPKAKARPTPPVPVKLETTGKPIVEAVPNLTDEEKVFAPLLDKLTGLEGGGADWESLGGGGVVPGVTSMTITEAIEAANWRAGKKKEGSGVALGRFQHMTQFLDERARKTGLDPDTDLFNEENQTKMALYLIKQRGVTPKLIEDDPDKAINQLAKEWAAIPVTEDMTVTDKHSPDGRDLKAGQSYYHGVGTNKAGMTVEEAKELLKEIKTE